MPAQKAQWRGDFGAASDNAQYGKQLSPLIRARHCFTKGRSQLVGNNFLPDVRKRRFKVGYALNFKIS